MVIIWTLINTGTAIRGLSASEGIPLGVVSPTVACTSGWRGRRMHAVKRAARQRTHSGSRLLHPRRCRQCRGVDMHRAARRPERCCCHQRSQGRRIQQQGHRHPAGIFSRCVLTRSGTDSAALCRQQQLAISHKRQRACPGFSSHWRDDWRQKNETKTKKSNRLWPPWLIRRNLA
jgi:hypothetical protein